VLRTVLDSAAVAVPLAFRNEDLNGLAQSMKGVEALVYPYLNRQLIERLDMARVIGIGAGRIGSSRRDEIDSLIVMDDDRTTVVRVPETFRTRRRLNGTIWVQLHDGKGTVEAKGWASDARLVVARRNAPGKLSRPFIVDGKTIRVADTDLSAKARRGKATVVYTVKSGDGG